VALAVALLYAFAVAILLFAWLRIELGRPKAGLCVLAAALALLAFSLPAMVAGFG